MLESSMSTISIPGQSVVFFKLCLKFAMVSGSQN